MNTPYVFGELVQSSLATTSDRSYMAACLMEDAVKEWPRMSKGRRRSVEKIGFLVCEFYGEKYAGLSDIEKRDFGKAACIRHVKYGLGLGWFLTWVLGGIISWIVQRLLDRMFVERA